MNKEIILQTARPPKNVSENSNKSSLNQISVKGES